VLRTPHTVGGGLVSNLSYGAAAEELICQLARADCVLEREGAFRHWVE
jgi:hypothetical protein